MTGESPNSIRPSWTGNRQNLVSTFMSPFSQVCNRCIALWNLCFFSQEHFKVHYNLSSCFSAPINLHYFSGVSLHHCFQIYRYQWKRGPLFACYSHCFAARLRRRRTSRSLISMPQSQASRVFYIPLLNSAASAVHAPPNIQNKNFRILLSLLFQISFKFPSAGTPLLAFLFKTYTPNLWRIHLFQ